MSSSQVKTYTVDITASQKHSLCSYKGQNAKATQIDCWAYFGKKRSITVGCSTVNDVFKEQAKWLAVAKESNGVLRAKSAKHASMERALYVWFSDVRACSLCVRDDMLIKKAKEFGDKLSVTDFLYSCGWLRGFKKHRGICQCMYLYF